MSLGSENDLTTASSKPKPPKTAKAGSKKMTFEDVDGLRKSPDSGPSKFSFREQTQLEYLLNRDPMQEFFMLTCQAIKLNSTHMNTICTIDAMQLYKKVVKLDVPFFRWHQWIEDSLNKEFMRAVLRSRSSNNQGKSKNIA